MQKCQLLANMCVMQMYVKSTVCDLYKDTVEKNDQGEAYPDYYKDKGFKRGVMPWLYYEENALSVI